MSEKKKLKIKTTYNNDTRRFKGDINFQALVKFVESAYQIPCSSFRLTYIDEDEDQLTLDANEFVDAVDFYHGTGSILKIDVVFLKSKPQNPTHSNTKVNKKNHGNTLEQLRTQRQQQEKIVLDLLQKNKPSSNIPDFLHKKSANVWKTQQNSGGKIQYKTKIWNETLIQIDKQADLDKKHWDQTKVSDEVSFRVKTVVRKLNNIKSLYDQIDLVQDVYKDLKQCENNLKYKHNKASMMRTQYNKVKESVFKAECCIKEIKLLQTDINFRMIKILKIKTNDNKPITYLKMDKTIFFETKRQTVVKDAEIYNFYENILKTISARAKKLTEYVQNIKTNNGWKIVNPRAAKKQNYNTGKRKKKMNSYWKEKPEKKEAWDKRKQEIQKEKLEKEKRKQEREAKKENKEKQKTNSRTRKRNTTDDAKNMNIIDMFKKGKKRKKRKKRNYERLFVYGTSQYGPNPILKYPPYHRAVTWGFVRRYETIQNTSIPQMIIYVILLYYCDNSCYKCGKTETEKNKDIIVKICDDKCTRFVCNKCAGFLDLSCVELESEKHFCLCDGI